LYYHLNNHDIYHITEKSLNSNNMIITEYMLDILCESQPPFKRVF